MTIEANKFAIQICLRTNNNEIIKSNWSFIFLDC